MSDFVFLLVTAVVSIFFCAALDLKSGPAVMSIGILMIIVAYKIRKRRTHAIAKLFKNLIVTNPNADLVGVAEGAKPPPKIKVTPKGWIVAAATIVALGAMVLPGTASGSEAILTPAPTQAVVDAIQATIPVTTQVVEFTVAPRSNTLDLEPTPTEIILPSETKAPTATLTVTVIPATATLPKPTNTIIIPPTKAPIPTAIPPTARPLATAIQPTAKPAISGCPQGCMQSLPGCLIKGNISSSKEKIYHVPGGGSYAATKIDPTKGERWFCTEAEAQANGWRRAKN